MGNPSTIAELDQATEVNKIGPWKGAFLLARGSWSTLVLDRELILLPVLSFLTAISLLFLFVVIAFGIGALNYYGFSEFETATPKMPIDVAEPWVGFGLFFLIGLILTLTTNFFTAALIAASLYRFSGGNPTINYSLTKAQSRLWPIFQYTLFASTVLAVLQFLQQRVPVIGKIGIHFFGVAWSVATIFAVPVIVASEKPLGPVAAVRESIKVFDKVWGKTFAGRLGLGLVFLLIMVSWLVFLTVSIYLSIKIGLGTLFVTIPMLGISLVLIGAISEALSAVFKAALFHFAMTGESPVNFDKELLKAAFKPKKKWFV